MIFKSFKTCLIEFLKFDYSVGYYEKTKSFVHKMNLQHFFMHCNSINENLLLKVSSN